MGLNEYHKNVWVITSGTEQDKPNTCQEKRFPFMSIAKSARGKRYGRFRVQICNMNFKQLEQQQTHSQSVHCLSAT
jgi:hypothetical protein